MIKPVLFNTDMVRGLLANRKTATRRVVKGYALEHLELDTDGSIIGVYDQFEGCVRPVMDYAPYRPGDILYVREAWAKIPMIDEGSFLAGSSRFYYRADGELNPDFIKWHPSIHMPREAARIFLRVTDVRVERLQDPFFKHGNTIFYLQREGVDIGEQCRECIDTYGSPCCIDDESECGILDEVRGEFADLWNRCYAKPRPIKGEDGTIDHYESYPWEDIQETREYKGKPWYVIGNPWVWVIEYERCGKPRGGELIDDEAGVRTKAVDKPCGIYADPAVRRSR